MIDPRLLRALELEVERRKSENRLRHYEPYPKQVAFHNAGAEYRERLFMAGNQLGKTWSSAYEIAIHLTGLYPDWWRGKRFDRPVVGWAGGDTGETIRDTLQRLVLGRPGEWGTGTIPKRLLIGDPKRAMGVSDLVDTINVRHVSGGISRLTFKSYEKGRKKWQGETLDFVALDEEPDLEIYTEALTRTNATKGIVWLTFTPLLGMSHVVRRFLDETNPQRIEIRMTIHDALHYTAQEREEIIASYPEHERKARALGEPVLGSGAVFPVAEERIVIPAFDLPDHFPRICGLDFGWDHPTAGAWWAHDRDNNIVYLYDAFRVRKHTPDMIAPLINARGPWIPVAWPADGLQTENGSGSPLADQYRDAGVNMLWEFARFEDVPDFLPGGKQSVSRTSVEAGITMMLQRMNRGKLKVFSHLEDWLSEYRRYHRKDGIIVKEGEDLISASRYGLMSLSYAALPTGPAEVVTGIDRGPDDWRM